LRGTIVVTLDAIRGLRNQSKASADIVTCAGKLLLRVLDRLSKSKRDFMLGLSYGYPLCCVLNFTIDSLLGVPSGLSRGESYSRKLGSYVPCEFHKRVKHALSSSESLRLLNSGYSIEHLAPKDLIETRVNGRLVSSMRVPAESDALYVSQIKLKS
jgi:hypothetical protein